MNVKSATTKFCGRAHERNRCLKNITIETRTGELIICSFGFIFFFSFFWKLSYDERSKLKCCGTKNTKPFTSTALEDQENNLPKINEA